MKPAMKVAMSCALRRRAPKEYSDEEPPALKINKMFKTQRKVSLLLWHKNKRDFEHCKYFFEIIKTIFKHCIFIKIKG